MGSLAPFIDLESAVVQFLAMGRELSAVKPLTGLHVLGTVTSWFRDVRIGGATEEGNDMLLLQWGATRPLDLSAPTDLRRLGDGKVACVPQKLTYLDFTRQVFAPEGEGDEFDDLAVQMSITLKYTPADGTEPDGNLWIARPDEVSAGSTAFIDEPFVKSLIGLPAGAVTVSVDHCG